MKIVPAALSTAIRRDHALVARPRLIAEWNMNRYGSPSADNIPAETTNGYDPDFFPIESIYQPNRPIKGMNKARVGEATVAHNSPLKQRARYYVVSDQDIYKYWCSPVESNASGVFPNHTDGQSVVRPHVVYDTPVLSNKIVVKFENHWASPLSFQILVKNSKATAWNYSTHVVATSPTINPDGTVVLYYTGSGWTTTRPTGTAPTTNVGGIMVKVSSLTSGRDIDGNITRYNGISNTTGRNSFFNLIEISARREVDLSGRLLNVDDNYDLAAESFIYPIGTITSNSGSITLSNIDGVFNPDNNDVIDPNFDFLPPEPNVNFNLEYVYTVGGTEYSVQQFNMYGGAWNGQTSDEISIDLTDYSKFFQEIKPRPTFYQGRTAGEIVWRLCDQVGFTNYEIQDDDLDTLPLIENFWTDGEKTIWELFDEISRATQCAIYFDAYGTLQIKSRTSALNKDRPVDWTFRAVPSGLELPDIVEMNKEGELEGNNITVTYRAAEFSPWNRGIPVTQRVWTAEDTITLRASPLIRSVEATDIFIWVPPEDAALWPWEGIINIQGELIRYNGKQYSYIEGGTKKTRTVNSLEEQQKVDALTATSNLYLNHYTGGLYITERGLWNSERKRHPIAVEGYSVRNIMGGNRNTDARGFSHNRLESTITLATPDRASSLSDMMVATRGNALDSGFYHYGTRVKFMPNTAAADQKAGLVIHSNGSNEDGYYIDITPTANIDTVGRTTRDEVLFIARKNGVNHKYGPNTGNGVAKAIRAGKFYDIDVAFRQVGALHLISIHVNGIYCFTAEVPAAHQSPFGGRFGVHARGKTEAQFEYLYGIARSEEPVTLEDFSFLNKVYGGYTGDQWDREWVYRWREAGRRRRKISDRERFRWNRQYFDEFGPIAHEVREFDVKFDPMPVLHSYIYLSNSWQAICAEYVPTAFGAKFVLANTSRTNAVINGEDSLSFAGAGDAIGQVATIFGRPLLIKDEETVNVKNEAQIRARGNIEIDIVSEWIQSKSAAEKLAKWIDNHWSQGLDVLSVNVFGNPLVEVGDMVAIDYPHYDMSPATHKYYVTGVATSFDEGMETRLTLRRRL